jgi:hypothetical protein
MPSKSREALVEYPDPIDGKKTMGKWFDSEQDRGYDVRKTLVQIDAKSKL